MRSTALYVLIVSAIAKAAVFRRNENPGGPAAVGMTESAGPVIKTAAAVHVMAARQDEGDVAADEPDDFDFDFGDDAADADGADAAAAAATPLGPDDVVVFSSATTIVFSTSFETTITGGFDGDAPLETGAA